MGEKKYIEVVWTYFERMESEEFVKKVHVSESVGPNSKGRLPGRWRNRVKEYMHERGTTRGGRLNQSARECLERERWRLFCLSHPLVRCSRMEEGIRAIDR